MTSGPAPCPEAGGLSPAAVAAAAGVLGDRGRRDVPVGPLTTYRVGGPAALFVEATSVDDLRAVGRAAAASGLPVLVLGRGSNLLVADEGFPGLVVTLAAGSFGGIDTRPEGLVRAGAAAYLPVLARQTAAAGLTGLEWAVGVPGSVGGAVRMNAGGHGSDISRCLVDCRWVDLGDGTEHEVGVAALAFGYRRSAVTDGRVVTGARFGLARGDRRDSEAAIRDIVQWRREHQPGGQNAGSVFTNPLADPPANSAGWVIEEAGLKGWRRGTATVSGKHANFVQADPGGRADDVRALILEVQRLVAERLGVTLQPELKMVGFPPFLHLNWRCRVPTLTRTPSPGKPQSGTTGGRPRMDPRIRERLLTVRREEGRHRLRLVALLVGVLALGAAAVGITHSPVLAVHHVEVSGTVHTQASELLAAAGLGHHPLMIDVHPAAVARKLAILPWVEQAAVSRHWPSTVAIRVTERRPVAVVAAGPGQQALVDRTGRVLALAPAGVGAVASVLPVLTGLGPAGRPGSSVAGDRSAVAALTLVTALQTGLPAPLISRVTGVSAAADGQLVVAVSPTVTVEFGPIDQLTAKVVALQTLLQQADLHGTVTIDLRVPDAPVLTRQGKGSTVSTTGGG